LPYELTMLILAFVGHWPDVVFLSLRQATLRVAMLPNPLAKPARWATPRVEALAPHGRLSPRSVKHSKQ